MLGWVSGLRTTSSTTSRGDFWALRASTPTLRQWRNAASRGRRRSAASETGISPAPPCRAMAHPIILSLSLSLSLSQAGFLLWKTESQRELSGTGLRSQCWKYVYVERRREWGDKGYCCKFQRRLRKCYAVAVNVPGSTNFVLLSSDSGVSSQVMFQQTDKSSSSTLSKERHFIKSNL